MQNGYGSDIAPENNYFQPPALSSGYSNPGTASYSNPSTATYSNTGIATYSNPGTVNYSNPGIGTYSNPGTSSFSNPGTATYSNAGAPSTYSNPVSNTSFSSPVDTTSFPNQAGSPPFSSPGIPAYSNPAAATFSNAGTATYSNAGAPSAYSNPGVGTYSSVGGAPSVTGLESSYYSNAGSSYQGGQMYASSPGNQFVHSSPRPHMQNLPQSIQRDMEEEGAFLNSSLPMDEALSKTSVRLTHPLPIRIDPPDGEPPSLSKREKETPTFNYSRDETSVGDPSFDDGNMFDHIEDQQHYDDHPPPSFSYDDEHMDQQYFDMPHGGTSFSPSGGTELLSPGPSEDSGLISEGRFIPSDVRSRPSSSPRSPQESEYSQSSVMRGAQEFIRKNRQRRLELQKQKELEIHELQKDSPLSPDTLSDDQWAQSPESEATWDNTSEFASTVSGSSVWTDQSGSHDRSSRRALILQMAKARMKGNKHAPIVEENEDEEEKKLDYRDHSNDIDLAQDLD
jgi:hypothetical protein